MNAGPHNGGRKRRVFVGTCGYSYPEWITAGFYPPGTRAADMLGLYAGAFPVVELNYTWYQMPKAASVARMVAAAPPGFLFAAKLNRSMTHEMEPNLWRGCAAQYREGISPLVQSGRLAVVLVQFSQRFTRDTAGRRYLAELLDELAGLPLAVEFRHSSWASGRVFAELARRRVAVASVDVPRIPDLFPLITEVTNPDFFYLRFHGRNTAGWRSGNMQKQFDYDYAEAELAPFAETIIPQMLSHAEKGFVFFNNHVRAQAPRNAATLLNQLAATGAL
ncbi:MAG: DUF72 domain-containing protein [Thermodesulfobacteriota bacterium]